MKVTLTVNGQERELDVPKGTPLLWVLRDYLGLTGTKYGCGVGQCGSCTVHLQGSTKRSCIIPIEDADGGKVTTIESVDGPEAEALRQAWIDLDVPQCGYCQAGQLMSAVALLREVPDPDDTDIDQAMSGNICRCGTYMRIRRGIKRAAEELQ
jgi:isoquinoline 1-oxidoreductase alpha subunit